MSFWEEAASGPGREGCGHHSRREGLGPELAKSLGQLRCQPHSGASSQPAASPGGGCVFGLEDPAQGSSVGGVLGGKVALAGLVWSLQSGVEPGLSVPHLQTGSLLVCVGRGERTPFRYSHQLALPSLAFP